MTIPRHLLSFKYHLPYRLSHVQKLFLLPYFGWKVLNDPTRGDLVAAIGDMTGELQLKRLKTILLQHDKGIELLKNRPLISNDKLNPLELQQLPSNSLGKQYSNFMVTYNFSADDRSKVKYIMDADLAYIMTRYRQVHDFWHVLVDLPPTVVGEIALKYYEWRITGLPVAALSSLLGPLTLPLKDQKALLHEYIPWVNSNTSDVVELLCFPYEDQLNEDIETVRNKLKIVPWKKKE